MNRSIDRRQMAVIRGIAILGIMLHNYCHFLHKLNVVQENEYRFFADRPQQLFAHLADSGSHLFVDLCSFFGCYGVPLFLFASGYGLVLKYEDEKYPAVGTGRFIWNHYRKLLRLMLDGFVLYILVCYLKPNGFHGFTFQNFVAQVLMYINLLPNPGSLIKPGPYWFFSLMLQLYIIYRLLLHRRHWSITVGLMVVCTVAQMCCGPESLKLDWLRYNFVGSVLPFGFGILYARYGKEISNTQWAIVAVLSIAVTMFAINNYYSWFFVPLFIITATVGIVKLLPQSVCQPLAWVGSISALLFVMHPVMREIIVWRYPKSDYYFGIAIYLLSTFALVLLFRECYKVILRHRR